MLEVVDKITLCNPVYTVLCYKVDELCRT